MFKQRSLSLITLALASFIGTLPILAEDKAQESFAAYISNKYLNSNFVTEEQPTISEEEKYANVSWYSNKELEKNLDTKRQILTKREAQEAAFSLVSPSFENTTVFENIMVIDGSVVNKLELIGGGENTSNHLMHKLFEDKIHTALGKAYTAFTFCNPTTDITLLSNRQSAITLLATQKQPLQTLQSLFKTIEKNEKKSLTHWHSKPIIQEQLLNSFYFSFGPLKQFNTSTVALSTAQAYQNAMAAISAAFVPMEIYCGLKMVKENLEAKALYLGTNEVITYSKMIKEVLVGCQKALKDPETPMWVKGSIIGAPILMTSMQTYMTWITKRLIEFLYEGTSHIQSILIATSNHVNQLKKLSTFVNKNKQLVQLLPTLKPLAEFNNPNKRSANLNRLLGMLDTNTFTGEPSFWSITGRVLAAHKLMAQVKDELAPVFAAAGELEMYVALAQLYNEQQGENATWCMANFVENSTTPVIEAQGFWNPFISPEVVVINDVVFNAEYPNSILTGPNTGGKSTVIKAVMFNVLMAQTFGMAPACSLTLTPFAKLNCFMNIADDIATGASLFKSEVMRAKELSAMISSLKEGEFSFVIIDEVFTGTSPVEGEMAALRFAQHLTTFPNSIAVIATHYPKMTTLEVDTNGKFYNHHVEILRNEDGSLNRTFKLKNGPTFFNVAFDILEEEGLVI